MKAKILVAVALLLSSPAVAQTARPVPSDPATLRTGMAISTADGRRIGRIDQIRLANGRPATVSVIYNARVVTIPVSTLSSSDRGLVTSLSRADLARR